MHSFANAHALAAAMIVLPAALLSADVDTKFHNAPASAQAAKNPYAGQEAAQAGKKPYGRLEVERELKRLRKVEQMVVSDPETMRGTPVGGHVVLTRL